MFFVYCVYNKSLGMMFIGLGLLTAAKQSSPQGCCFVQLILY